MPSNHNPQDGNEYMTREDARLIVRETLIAIGLDINDPIESQADAMFVRKMRKTHERVGSKIVLSMVGFFMVGTATLIVMGLVSWIKSNAGGA